MFLPLVVYCVYYRRNNIRIIRASSNFGEDPRNKRKPPIIDQTSNVLIEKCDLS